MIKSEPKVQKHLVNALRSEYDRQNQKSSHIKEEVRVKSEDDVYTIDVAIPMYDIAIECKDNDITNIKAGVGQGVRYQVDDWNSYLCIPMHKADKSVVDMCMQAGIGLIEVSDWDIHDGKRVNVTVQNNIPLRYNSTGYLRGNSPKCMGDEPIDIPQILDVMGVETIDDVIEINEKLSKLRKKVVDDDRWRDIRSRRDIFPEE